MAQSKLNQRITVLPYIYMKLISAELKIPYEPGSQRPAVKKAAATFVCHVA